MTQTSIFDHTKGEQFIRMEYDLDELSCFARKMAVEDGVQLSRRAGVRVTDEKLNLLEVFDAVREGRVATCELGPSRTEMRLEIAIDQGDMRNYLVVVWLSMNHRLFVEDLRDKPSGIDKK